jgi:hypothetical protein
MARYRELVDHQKNQRKKMFLTQAGKMQEISPITTKFQSRPTMVNAMAQGDKKGRRKDSPRSQKTTDLLEEVGTPNKKDKSLRRMSDKAKEPANQPVAAQTRALDSDGFESSGGMKEDDENENAENETFRRTSEAVFVKGHGYHFAQEETDERTYISEGSHLSPRGHPKTKKQMKEPLVRKEKAEAQKAEARQRGSIGRVKESSKYEVAEETFVQRVARSLREDTRRGCMMPAGGLRSGEDAAEDGEAAETDEAAFLDPQLLPPVGLLSPSQKHSLLRQLRQQAHFKMKRGMAKISLMCMMNKGNAIELCRP